MADESNELPPSRIVRWMVLGAVVLLAVGLYFRSGRDVPPLGGGEAAPAGPAAAQPTR